MVWQAREAGGGAAAGREAGGGAAVVAEAAEGRARVGGVRQLEATEVVGRAGGKVEAAAVAARVAETAAPLVR